MPQKLIGHPKLSIVIPSGNPKEILDRCLNSLAEQKTSFEVEVVVVQDPQGLGSSHSRNLGIARSRGEFILFLDDDCTLGQPNSLESLMNLLLEFGPQTVIAGMYFSPEKSSLWTKIYNLTCQAWVLYRSTTPHPIGLGGCLVVPRSLLRGTRLFPASLHSGAEDEFLKNISAENSAMKVQVTPHWGVLHDPLLTLKTFRNRVKDQQKYGPTSIQKVNWKGFFSGLRFRHQLAIGVYWFASIWPDS